MGEAVPGVAVIAVVLADRAPLPLAEVGAPFLPRDLRLSRLVQPFLLSDIHRRVHGGLLPAARGLDLGLRRWNRPARDCHPPTRTSWSYVRAGSQTARSGVYGT